ncbi:TPA: hypothetical protein ACIBS5_000519 [Salmonella enterica subsp. diarizonae serovar 60-67:z35:-]
MSKLTPVSKCCNDMTLIASWPDSYPYKPEMSEALLLTRVFDVSVCHYAQQFAQTYKDMTGYDLPFITLTDDEVAAIRAGCARFIAETEAQKQVAQQGVDKAEKHLEDIKKGVIRPDERHPLRDLIQDANIRIVNETKRRDNMYEKLDKKINLLKSAANVKPGDDFTHVIDADFRDFSQTVAARANFYKSIISALRRITSLTNDMSYQIISASVIHKRSNTEADFINNRIELVTLDYYRSDNEVLRNCLSLAEYTELHLLKIKEDARINTIIKMGINEPVMS